MKNKNLKAASFSWAVTIILLFGAAWYKLSTRGGFGILWIILGVSLVGYLTPLLYLKIREDLKE